MSKRTAASELNDRNWDQEDEKEEAGEFVKASDDAMKQRQIIKPKRRGTSSIESGSSSSVSTFSGFSFKPTNTSTPFSFNVKKSIVKNGDSQNGTNGDSEKVTKTESENKETQNTTTKSTSSYLQDLKSLNESVLNWIKSHVEKNPYCILTPIFQDYEKHLKGLEEEKEKDKSSASSSVSSKTDATGSVITSSSSSENNGSTKTETPALSPSKTEKPALFSSKTETPAMSSNLFSSATSTTTPAFPGFSFKSNSIGGTAMASSGFSFAVGNKEPAANTGNTGGTDDGEEEYVPPKPEVKEVQEEGSIYSIKCKLFYQKDGTWTERGIGHLHLKEIDDKAQLLVRADTNLGNILLNIMLSSSIPLKRQGKNNVSLICVPNPPINPKDDPATPVPMLIRVKTAEDADQLLEKMDEIRNKS